MAAQSARSTHAATPAGRSTHAAARADDTRPVAVVLRALGLGDMLTAIPALRGVRAALPRHRIILACPAVLGPLVALADAVDEVRDTAPLAPPDADLHGCDVAINLHGRGPQSHRLLLGLDPGRLVAFAHPDVSESADGPTWRADEHEVARWARMLRESGIPAEPDPGLLRLPAPADVPAVPGAAGATLVHPGAASPARRWPPERWAAVARAEVRRGRSVLVTGGPDERDIAEQVAALAGLPGSAVLAGRTSLPVLAATVAAAGRVTSGDTGMSHLATALGTPSVTLFGPVSPALWGPPDVDGRHRVLWAGRTGDPHGRDIDPGLLQIGAEDVIAALA